MRIFVPLVCLIPIERFMSALSVRLEVCTIYAFWPFRTWVLGRVFAADHFYILSRLAWFGELKLRLRILQTKLLRKVAGVVRVKLTSPASGPRCCSVCTSPLTFGHGA